MRLATPILLLVALLAGALWLDRAPPRAELVLANTAEPFSLDPQRLSYQHDVRTARALFEGLTEIDGDTGEVRPAAAESWSVSDDGRTWTFRLRAGLRWSDGAPPRLHEVERGERRAVLPDLASDYAGFLLNIRGAREVFAWREGELKRLATEGCDAAKAEALWTETQRRLADGLALRAPDDRTLVVELDHAVPYWLQLCAFPALFPVPPALVERFSRLDASTGRLVQDARWTRAGNLVGNGPYRLVEWRPKRLLRLERNEHFHGAGDTAIRTIDILPIEDPNTAVLAFENGAVDWLTDTLAEYRGDMREQARAGTRSNLHVLDAFGTDFFGFNCRPQLADGRVNPFADARVRRAFALAIDKQALVDRITRLGERVSGSLVPPGSLPGYEPPAGLGFDPDRARREFTDAGWTPRDGEVRDAGGEAFPTVEISYPSNSPRYRDMSAAIADMWQRALGVRCATRAREPRSLSEALKKGDFMVARGGWFGDYGDPTTWLELARSDDGNNDRRYACPEFDDLLERAERELDPVRRAALLQQAERILVERDLPMVPICQYVTVYMFDPSRLSGISRHPRLEQYPARLRLAPRP